MYHKIGDVIIFSIFLVFSRLTFEGGKNDYRISANSFHRNYSFNFDLTLCTVTFGYRSQVRELFVEIRYMYSMLEKMIQALCLEIINS